MWLGAHDIQRDRAALERLLAGGLERRVLLSSGLHLFFVLGGVGVFLADPVVALFLEQRDQLRAAIFDDPAAEEDVDELRA